MWPEIQRCGQQFSAYNCCDWNHSCLRHYNFVCSPVPCRSDLWWKAYRRPQLADRVHASENKRDSNVHKDDCGLFHHHSSDSFLLIRNEALRNHSLDSCGHGHPRDQLHLDLCSRISPMATWTRRIQLVSRMPD